MPAFGSSELKVRTSWNGVYAAPWYRARIQWFGQPINFRKWQERILYALVTRRAEVSHSCNDAGLHFHGRARPSAGMNHRQIAIQQKKKRPSDFLERLERKKNG